MNTKIILEIGYNHQGDINIAKKLIDEAKELGVYGVKFQKWSVDNFPENIKNIKRDFKNSFGKTYYEHRKYLEFSIEQLKELKKYANNNGLVFVMSGKDMNSIEELVKMNCEIIKVPSQRYKHNEIYNYLFNERKKHGFQIQTSCGMNHDNEIINSKWIKHSDIFYYCVSQYPPKKTQMNFEFMQNLFSLRNYQGCGYSSHDIDLNCIYYAIVLGATYLERHYTFDKKAKGTDHKLSSDLKEMKKIIKSIEDIEIIMGDGTRRLDKNMLDLRKYYQSF